MSRTHKNPDWFPFRSPKPQWRGQQQAIRDNLRAKIRDRDHYDHHNTGDHHAAMLGNAIYGLFHKGYSIEQIRKRLVGRWPSAIVTGYIDQCLNLRGWRSRSAFNFEILELVCVSEDGFLIPLSSANCDPHLLININLPIYYQRRIDWTHPKTGAEIYTSYWGSGPIVLMNERIYKFPSTRIRNKGNSAQFTEKEILAQKLELWPQERVTEILNVAANMFFEGGMKKHKYEVMGWNNLHFTIDDNCL